MNGPLGEIVKKFQKSRADKVAVVRLDGVIGHVGAGRGMTIDSVEPMLKRAFETEHVKAVVVVINSPGGSPAQSEYIAERIRQLSSEKGVPVLAFCEDIAASGGYWIACAADEIFAAHTSLVGSIGVVSSGFGFNEVLDRLGVQDRRVRGLAMGSVSHGVGTSRSLHDSVVEGAFAGLSMGLTALATSLIVPVVVAALL